jgi:hypothetical protein
MKCEQIKILLSEYIDATIEAEGLKLVDEHIKKCDNCRYEYVSMKNMVDELKNMESISTPPDFVDKVINRIEKRSLIDKLKEVLFFNGHLRIPMELTAFVATAFLVFVILFNFMIDRKPNENDIVIKPNEVKIVDNNEIDPRLRGKGPIHLEFLLGASEGAKPISSNNLTSVSSGKSSAGNLSEYMFGVEEERAGRKEDMIISHIDTIISHVGGKVLSRGHRKGMSYPEYVTMEIPADKYSIFLKRIESFGSFQPPAPVLPEGYLNPVVLRVQFKSTD